MSKPRKPSQATDFKRSPCPVTNTLDILGDKWTLLVVRDLFLGKRLYREFTESPEGIPTNILADRLKRLEAAGIIRKEPYQERPVRYAYALTGMGEDLLPVLAEGAGAGFTTQRLRFRQEAAACVVLASAPYPARPETGEPITGLEAAAGHAGVEVFHAGTAERDGRVVTSGDINALLTRLDLPMAHGRNAEAVIRAHSGVFSCSWEQCFNADNWSPPTATCETTM